MRPRSIHVPRRTLAIRTKTIQQQRFASTSTPAPSALTEDATPLWRGRVEPQTKIGQSITGAMEWQTSMYSFNKQGVKPIPVATDNLEKLIQNYITAKRVRHEGLDQRRIRTALAARRKTSERVFVSKPKVKEYGDWIEVRAFLWDGKGAIRPKPGSEESAAQKRDRSKEEGVKFVMDEALTKPLTSLIERIYGKRVQLHLTELEKPHLDADILAAYVAQRLRDRRFTPRGVIKDATWRVALPSTQTVSEINNAKVTRQPTRFDWRDFTIQNAVHNNATSILESLRLSQVSSLEVEAAGRLTKRLTANRSAKKSGRKGANNRQPAYMVRGFRKAHTQYAFASGKRRVGQFGIKVQIGHT